MAAEKADKSLSDIVEYRMVKMLISHGWRFAGNEPGSTAEAWLDRGFWPDDAAWWCTIGVWNAATAAALRDAGLRPSQVSAAVERLMEGGEYSDIDVIYAICNGDLDVAIIIEAARGS
jgi:hypothetical protein